MSEVKRPLEGVKVVEMATFIAAPCTARFLADLGAFLLDAWLLRRGKLTAPWQQILGLLILWAVAFCFVWCTFRPVKLALWMDPVTGTFGA